MLAAGEELFPGVIGYDSTVIPDINLGLISGHDLLFLGEKPSVPRISDLSRIYSSSLGKLELDLMGSHQMSERQVLDSVLALAIRTVFEEYVDKHGLAGLHAMDLVSRSQHHGQIHYEIQ